MALRLLKLITSLWSLMGVTVTLHAQEGNDCFILSYYATWINQDGSLGQRKKGTWWYGSQEKCKKDLETYSSSTRQIEFIKSCEECKSSQHDSQISSFDQMGSNQSNSSNWPLSSHSSTLQQEILFDEYNPNIGYVFNIETKEYVQIQLPPELARQRKEELEAELRSIETANQQERIERAAEFVNQAVEGIETSIDRHKDRMEALKESRSKVKDEELPIIDEDFSFNSDYNDSHDFQKATVEKNNSMDVIELSRLLETTVQATSAMDNGPSETLVGSAREILDQVNIVDNLHKSIHIPNDLDAKVQVYEYAITKIADVSGTAGVAFKKFSPPMNLLDDTYRATANRLENLLKDRQTSSTEILAPTMNYIGSSMGISSIGDFRKAYEIEGTLSLKELNKKYGIIQGTWRKVLYHLFDDANDYFNN